MKLGGWRSLAYPLRIVVDDKEVFNATTERNLGYYTAVFPPTKGKRVSIALAGASSSGDGFNGIVEVTGKKLESGESGNDNQSLELIEVEIYERNEGASDNK